jgi:hypothetical protein
MNEVKRLQKLAGLLKENEDDEWDLEAGPEWNEVDSLDDVKTRYPNMYNNIIKNLGSNRLIDYSFFNEKSKSNLNEIDKFYSPSYNIIIPPYTELINKRLGITEEQYKQIYKMLYKFVLHEILYTVITPYGDEELDEDNDWYDRLAYHGDTHWVDLGFDNLVDEIENTIGINLWDVRDEFDSLIDNPKGSLGMVIDKFFMKK